LTFEVFVDDRSVKRYVLPDRWHYTGDGGARILAPMQVTCYRGTHRYRIVWDGWLMGEYKRKSRHLSTGAEMTLTC
jgi:hypothetical protein